MSQAGHDPNFLPVQRSEALSDGIYAVAMTLLVIELKLPDASAIHTAGDLSVAMVALLPKAIAWVISFFVLGIFWTAHHRVFGYVRHCDATLVQLNLFQLATVSLMPFSSALSGEEGDLLLSQIVFSSNMALLAISGQLIARRIYRHPELCLTPFSRARYRGASLRIAAVVAVSAMAVLIAALWPGAGLANMAFMLMAAISPATRALEQHELKHAAEASIAAPDAR